MHRTVLKNAILHIFLCAAAWTSLACTASAAETVIGVNVVGVEHMTTQQQDALIEQLAANKVKTVRLGLGDKYDRFIISAYKRGISSVAIVYPTQGATGAARPADPSAGLGWSAQPLSHANPQAFQQWLKPQLAVLEASGVRLAAFELGNEINNAQFNGDFSSHSDGRVLGYQELANPNDPQMAALAAGYRAYVKIAQVMKEVRDQSKLNRATPVISAGLSDPGMPRAGKAGRPDSVSIAAALEYLRRNGIDKFVDAYGVHTYPGGGAAVTPAQRYASLDKETMSMCSPSKPCWLTEWGFNSPNDACPDGDQARAQVVGIMRDALKKMAAQDRLKASLYFSWSGKHDKMDSTIFRCGALTGAGKLALGPL